MSTVNKFLSACLLIIIGLFLGLNWQILNQPPAKDLAQVQKTDIFVANDAKSERLFDPDRPHLAEVAKAVTSSVVFIESSISMRKSVPEDGNHDFDERFWRRFGPGRTTAAGSGIVMSADGYILTNNHVIDGADEGGIIVHLSDRSWFDAKVVGTDPSTDLAVLKITNNSKTLNPVIFGNSDDVEIGDWVLAIGNPLRLRSTVTAGIVSALGRTMDIIDDRLRVESFIQTDAAINQGNSGGALVNVKGELIGINTAIATRTGSYQGYGFAVPANLARKVATDIIETGKVRRALIGVTINSIDFDRAKRLGLSKVAGVDIVQVLKGGAADLAGIEPRDVVLAVDGLEVLEVNNLQERIALHLPGDVVELQVFRKGEILSFPVTLQAIPEEEEKTITEAINPWEDELPEQGLNEAPTIEKEQDLSNNENEVPLEDEAFEMPTPKNPAFGLKTYAFTDLAFTLMELDRTAEDKGIDYLISKVSPKSVLWEKGLRSGQTIIKVDGKRPKSMEQIIELIQAKKEKKAEVTLLLEKADGRRLQIKYKHK